MAREEPPPSHRASMYASARFTDLVGVAAVALCLAAVRPSPLLAQGQTCAPHAALPERPTIATHAHTIDVGYVELETGVQGLHPQEGETEYDTPTLVKLGVGSHLQFDVYEGITALSYAAQSAVGLGDISAGFKWRVLDAAPVVGDFAVQSTVKFPTGSVEKGTGTGTTDLNVILISSHEIHGASLDVNVAFTARSGDGSVTPTRATLWTVSWGLPVHGRLSWSAELFGYPGTRGTSGRQPIVALLNGPTWTLRPDIVLDAGVILALVGPQAVTGYAGVTWNVGRLWGRREHAPCAHSGVRS